MAPAPPIVVRVRLHHHHRDDVGELTHLLIADDAARAQFDGLRHARRRQRHVWM